MSNEFSNDANRPPDSDGRKQPPLPEAPYHPYAESSPNDPPYEPYAKKPVEHEPRYEPYKDI